MSKPAFSLLCLLLALFVLEEYSVNAQSVSIPCSYVVRYENCPDAEQTVCSVYPGICVSASCQPSEYYNGCYACSDPTVMAFSIGSCGSSSGGLPTNSTTNGTDPSAGDSDESTEALINGGGSEFLELGEDASGYIEESDIDGMLEVDISSQEFDAFNQEETELEETPESEQTPESQLTPESQQASTGSTSSPITFNTTGTSLGTASTTGTINITNITTPAVTLRQSFYVVVYCDSVRPTNCTNDVNPVCAISCVTGICQQTVSNICLACANTNILSYSLGSCEENPIQCPIIDFTTDNTTCTSFYDPVCAYPQGCTSKSCATTVTNSCGACYTSQASYFTLGPC